MKEGNIMAAAFSTRVNTARGIAFATSYGVEWWVQCTVQLETNVNYRHRALVLLLLHSSLLHANPAVLHSDDKRSASRLLRRK